MAAPRAKQVFSSAKARSRLFFCAAQCSERMLSLEPADYKTHFHEYSQHSSQVLQTSKKPSHSTRQNQSNLISRKKPLWPIDGGSRTEQRFWGGEQPSEVKWEAKWDRWTSTTRNWRWWGQEWETEEKWNRGCTFSPGFSHQPSSQNWWFKIKMNSALPDNNVFKNVDYGL